MKCVCVVTGPPVTLPMSTNGTAVVTVTPEAVASHVFNATPGSFWTNVRVGRLQAAAYSF